MYIILLTRLDDAGEQYYEFWDGKFYPKQAAAEVMLTSLLARGHGGMIKKINLDDVREEEGNDIMDVGSLESRDSKKVDFGTPLTVREMLVAKAFEYRESILSKADGMHLGIYPWWHGWAIVEAYQEGYASGKEDGQLEAN